MTPSTILAQELGEVCRHLAGASGVDASLLERLQRARDLAAGLDPYLDQCTTPESAALTELARRTRETDWAAPEAGNGRLEQEMLSGHVEGQVLKFLVHLADARRVLEIGMFTGYSALAMAEALPDDGVVVACEIDPDVARFAEECFAQSPAGRKITVEVGPAIESLRRLAASADAAPFDFVFVDADKAGYLDYVEFLLAGDLLAPRAVIAVDNTLMQGQPYGDTELTVNGAAIASFNAALTYDPRVEQVLIPLRDGLTLIRRTP
ncbi:class I SAM-dependent methyltransferase [Mycobacterium yunnanensis]|uniref:Class I SAM-dependent methyltransferase n=1 Tax=Mycobacterium yunnanensis TaxID=368477 RepID=A0A9X2YHX8_9MYCO|nr:class I SAM-dependent methyltransferase [Mycobacterium yunnanensis]